VKPGGTVAIAFHRSLEQYVALLGILEAGCAYLPIDVADPPERVRIMLADSGARMIVCDEPWQSAHGGSLDDVARLVPFGDAVSVCDAGAPAGAGPAARHPESLMYVIYTSGTTGQPKGVGITQRSLSNFTRWCIERHAIDATSRVCQNAPLTFDPSVQQIFPAFATGATLVPVPEEVLRDTWRFAQWLRVERISHVDFVTSHWLHMLADIETMTRTGTFDLPDLRWIVIGGETLHYHQIRRWERIVRSPVRFNNIYGPTEATINATEHEVDLTVANGKVPIGRPLPGYQIYVTAADGRRCAPGVPGEIYIGGEGVALGYRDARRTAEAFVPDAFGTEPGRRLYRTGDLGRWLPAAAGEPILEFVGRVDSQVKISGYRIELEEIDAAAKACPGIDDAATAVAGSDELRRLVCCFASQTVASTDLGDWLRSRLPRYMVPARCLALPAGLPYTRNGKLDRRALLAHVDALVPADVATEPRTELERALVGAWSSCLGTDSVGVDAHFFDLGGNSFLALSLLNRIRRTIDFDCRLADLYRHPTPERFAAFVTEQRQPTVADRPVVRTSSGAAPSWAWKPLDELGPEGLNLAVEAESRPGRSIPLSPQDRFNMRSADASSAQNVIELRFHAVVDPEVLASAVAAVVARHEMLRGVLDREAQTLVLHEAGRVLLPWLRDAGVPATDGELARALAARSREPGRWPRFGILLVGDPPQRLLWSVGHDIADGESLEVLAADLIAAWRAAERGDEAFAGDESPSYEAYAMDMARRAPAADSEAARTLPAFEAAARRARAWLDDQPAGGQPYSHDLVFGEPAPTTDLVAWTYGASARALARWTGLSEVALLAPYHGRRYGEATYFSVIGNLVDHVPLLVPAAADMANMHEHLRRSLASAQRWNYSALRQDLHDGALSSPFQVAFFDEVLGRQERAAPVTVAWHTGQSVAYQGGCGVAISTRRLPSGLEVRLDATGLTMSSVRVLHHLIEQEHRRCPVP
jgi:nonribosomal peptide synthetase protein VioG